jgi:uncharacterized membrane protein HdeD (DUF308 family)
VFALRGLAAALFGVVTLARPIGTLEALVDGAMALGLALGLARSGQTWWPLAGQGAVGVLAGLATWAWPDLTALVLLYPVALWAVLGGVGAVVAALQLPGEAVHRWLLGLSGLASAPFGLYLAAYPADGAVAVVRTIGLYALVEGALLLALGLLLLVGARQPAPRPGGVAPA